MDKVILFDYDGTILNSMDVVYKEYNKIAVKYNMKKVASFKDFMDLYDANIYDSFFKLGLDKKQTQEFISDFRRPLIEADDDLSLFNKMDEVVEKISKKHLVIVITSNVTEVVEHSINNHGIKGVSEVIGGDKEISKVKKIKSIIGRYPKAQIYYVGDTKGDIVESKKIGAIAVAVTWGHHSSKKLSDAGADYIVDKPEELLNILC
ncbi:MAG: HAD hydrolase-like protein [Nanoarchaeota archaeon]|nr:HAD hydrolase-like protein [Nanoarchaeota archaeon]